MADNKKSMQKYNLSLIMRRAWKIFRENGGKISWSDCLKQSWSIAKNNIGIDFNSIYQKYYPIILFFIVGKVGSKSIAEELTNDVFVKVSEHLQNYDVRTAKLNTWIMFMSNNRVTDYYRSKAKKNYDKTALIDGYKDESGNETYQINAHDLNGQERLENKELGNRLNNAFNGLSEKYREVAKMALIEKMSIKEISTVLDKPENTVKVQIMRAKEMLREKLQGVY